MLTLPIKKKWFDLILSGEKTEEYRTHNDYYFTRFANLFGVFEYNNELLTMPEFAKDKRQKIRFRNGYSSSSPSFVAECELSIGKGKKKWGADTKETYYILKIVNIVEVENEHIQTNKEREKK